MGELENVILSEVSQSQKDTYYMYSLQLDINHNVQDKQTQETS